VPVSKHRPEDRRAALNSGALEDAVGRVAPIGKQGDRRETTIVTYHRYRA
jgi:hypothetical protein